MKRLDFSGLRRAIVSANGTYVAMESHAFDRLVGVGMGIAGRERVTNGMLAAACEVSPEAPQKEAVVMVPTGPKKRTAIMSLRGVVTYDIDFPPYAISTKAIAARVRECMADDTCNHLVLLCDTPGGTVVGLPEASDAIYSARESGMKVTAIVETLCASAGYWLASQASEIVVMPSAMGIGSIGVRMTHVECSRMLERDGITYTHIHSGDYKVEGNFSEPLDDVARERFQLESDTIYSDFLASVARGRGVTVQKVRDDFGQGRVLMPSEAKRVGMCDRLETPDKALARLGLIASDGDRRAEDEATPVTADSAPALEDQAQVTDAEPIAETPETPVEEMGELSDTAACDTTELSEADARRGHATEHAKLQHKLRLLELD
jgi:signal peptide peptidase SppA